MSTSDLSLLSRQPGAATATSGSAASTEVPPPPSHWKTRYLLPGLILLVTAGLFAASAGTALWPATPVKVVPVVAKSDVDVAAAGEVIVQAPGWVEPDPFPLAVSALAGGVVEEVLVLEGDHVERGQVVARLVAEDAHLAVQQAKATLDARQAAVAAADATLTEARQNWEHPIELQRALATAEARVTETRAELERWPAELAREEARLAYLNAEYERVAPLHEHGQASDIEWVEAKQSAAAQRAHVEAIRGREAVLRAQLERLVAEVAAAEQALALRIADRRAVSATQAAAARARAELAAAQAAYEEAALRLERMEVRAPAGGRVMTRLVEPGSRVTLATDDPRSAQIVRLYDPARLQVRVDVPLVEAAKVQVGQPAEVIVDVLPDRVFGGRVTRVVREADVQKNTLQVKVAIEEPSPKLAPEMLARARFLGMPSAAGNGDDGSASAKRLFVPRAAIFEESGQAYAWQADQVERVARKQAVRLGRVTVEGWVLVNEGLQPGDRVIVSAPRDLTDGQRIRLIEEGFARIPADEALGRQANGAD